MHLFPHVELPGDVGICVIFIAGPAVELSLDEFSLDGQLSGNCKHEHVTPTFSQELSSVHMTPPPRVRRSPGGGAACTLELAPAGEDFMLLETLSPALSLCWKL